MFPFLFPLWNPYLFSSLQDAWGTGQSGLFAHKAGIAFACPQFACEAGSKHRQVSLAVDARFARWVSFRLPTGLIAWQSATKPTKDFYELFRYQIL